MLEAIKELQLLISVAACFEQPTRRQRQLLATSQVSVWKQLDALVLHQVFDSCSPQLSSRQCCYGLPVRHGIGDSWQVAQASIAEITTGASCQQGQCLLAGTSGAEYFDLMEEQVADAGAAAHLVAHDMLTSLMHHIKQHAAMLIQAEYGCSLDILGPLNSNEEQSKAAKSADMHARQGPTGSAQRHCTVLGYSNAYNFP